VLLAICGAAGVSENWPVRALTKQASRRRGGATVGQEPSPLPLVLLHGFTNTGASWQPVVAALGTKRQAVAPDIRGHGKASARRPVTLEAVLGDLEGFVDGPFALCGYSMGGRIALHAALAFPRRVARLTLIGASPGLADARERAVRRAADERLAAELQGLDIASLARRWAATPVLADQPAHVAAASYADRLRSTPDGLAAALRGLGTGALPSLWGRLGELDMPVMLIAGERDRKFAGIAARMAAAIPHARVEIVAGAGHAVHLEAPERVAQLLEVIIAE
jgi:2-succinyl-6-hydroxy-2,4-cyclohexadiene-1-carboxylate synthase